VQILSTGESGSGERQSTPDSRACSKTYDCAGLANGGSHLFNVLCRDANEGIAQGPEVPHSAASHAPLHVRSIASPSRFRAQAQAAVLQVQAQQCRVECLLLAS
jgi:hypothetical protein